MEYYNYRVENNISFDEDKKPIFNGVKYYKNNTEITKEQYETESLSQIKAMSLRQERYKLFRAFDVYKTNVQYGIEQDANREAILTWYQQCLDLNEQAINNPPIEITKYLT